ncbi:hypothetical protein BDN72DRAFT_906230 [Pluteus cervinus]|uniref:Uncharacterized protein n=1 Tax=Pluteus cervinus TaxID=181527 RepID=A0ACD2ZZI4_9AGAR|nr:hypothetical protein BDN72DRAFT_906230 [Pluteus cervinus]
MYYEPTSSLAYDGVSSDDIASDPQAQPLTLVVGEVPYWDYPRFKLDPSLDPTLHFGAQIGGGGASDEEGLRCSSRAIKFTPNAPAALKRAYLAKDQAPGTTVAAQAGSTFVALSPSNSSAYVHIDQPATPAQTMGDNDPSAWPLDGHDTESFSRDLGPLNGDSLPNEYTTAFGFLRSDLGGHQQQSSLHDEAATPSLTQTTSPFHTDQLQSAPIPDRIDSIDHGEELNDPTHPTTASSSSKEETLSGPPGAVSNSCKLVVATCAQEVRRALDNAVEKTASRYTFDDMLSLVVRELKPTVTMMQGNNWNMWQGYLKDPENRSKELKLSLSEEELAGIPDDGQALSQQVVVRCYKSFLLRHPDDGVHILKHFKELQMCIPRAVTRGRREQTFRQYLDRLSKLTSESHTRDNIETICLVTGSIMGEDDDLHGSVFTPHAENFFKEHGHIETPLVTTRLKAHVYNRVALTQSPFEFDALDGLDVTDRPPSSESTPRTATAHSSGPEKFNESFEGQNGEAGPSTVSSGDSTQSGSVVATAVLPSISEYKTAGGPVAVQKMLESCASKAGLQLGRKKHFPWASLIDILKVDGYTIYNWPEDCPFPGTETTRNGDRKARGLSGLKLPESMALYGGLMATARYPMEFRKFKGPACEHKLLMVGVPQPPESDRKQRVYTCTRKEGEKVTAPARGAHPTLDKPEVNGTTKSGQIGGGPALEVHPQQMGDEKAVELKNDTESSSLLEETASKTAPPEGQDASIPTLAGSSFDGSSSSDPQTRNRPPTSKPPSKPTVDTAAPGPTLSVDEPIERGFKSPSSTERETADRRYSPTVTTSTDLSNKKSPAEAPANVHPSNHRDPYFEGEVSIQRPNYNATQTGLRDNDPHRLPDPPRHHDPYLYSQPAFSNRPSRPLRNGHYRSHSDRYPPQNGHYPPQNGHYPPQSGHYPPQSGHYPPQNGRYHHYPNVKMGDGDPELYYTQERAERGEPIEETGLSDRSHRRRLEEVQAAEHEGHHHPSKRPRLGREVPPQWSSGDASDEARAGFRDGYPHAHADYLYDSCSPPAHPNWGPSSTVSRGR